jgi:hypothetical protein
MDTEFTRLDFCDLNEDLYEYISYLELIEAEEPLIGGAVRHVLFSLHHLSNQPLLSTTYRSGEGKEVGPGHFSIY